MNRAASIQPVIRGCGQSAKVWIGGKELEIEKSLRIRRHSPTGFAWGYGGSGPAQLSLAILLELTDQKTAELLYQQFKFEVISGYPVHGDFAIPVKDVRDWIACKQKQLMQPF